MNADQAATEVRENIWGDRGFPVDPVTIARTLGLEVLEAKLPENVSGAVIKEVGKDAIIYVHTEDSENRKRFTVAHELGHFILKSDSGNDKFEYVDLRADMAKQGKDDSEIFANQFAAGLLMPRAEVGKLWRKHKSTSVVAALFGVSTDAMRFRLKNLGLVE